MVDEDRPPKWKNVKSAKEFIQIFRRGVQFTEELLAENERLRFRLAQLEEESRALVEQALGTECFKDLLDRMRSLEEQRHHLLQRFEAVESENKDYAQRYREMEAETDRLANLYVASYQLHSTLDLTEVVRISFELLINLIGAHRFALFVADGAELIPVKSHGLNLEEVATAVAGEGLPGQAANRRELYLPEGEVEAGADQQPLACVPLQVADRLIGMIVVYGFLPQKRQISDLDHELFRLLATHASTALYAAALSATVGDDARDAVAVLRSIAG